MSPKLLMFLIFVFSAGTLMSLTLEGNFFGSSHVTVMNYLTGYNVEQISGIGFFGVPKMAMGFMTHGIPKTLMWDYSYLQGDWQLFKWIVLMPISAGIVWGITQLFILAIQGIFSKFI